jgi:hypothetical protein
MARAGFHPNRSVIEIADILRLHGQDYARVHAAHLVAAVIGSAVIPTVIANAFYLPRHLLPKTEMEDMAGQQQTPVTRLPQLVRRAE